MISARDTGKFPKGRPLKKKKNRRKKDGWPLFMDGEVKTKYRFLSQLLRKYQLRILWKHSTVEKELMSS